MFLGLSVAGAALALYTACSDGSGNPSNDAGAQLGTGGAASENTGGGASTGGAVGAGGGVSETTGGTSSAATSTSSAKQPFIVNSFDDSQQVGQFQASTYVDTDCSVNVAAPNDAGRSLQIDWSGQVDTDADALRKGAMKVTATFTNWNQYWEVDMVAPTDANGDPIDLTNKLVTAQIKVTSGLSPNASYPYGAILFVKTGGEYVWGASKWTNIESMNGFVTLQLDATSPQNVPSGLTWDPTSPKQLGIKLGTGGAGESPYCGGNYGAPFGAPQETVAYIDDLKITDRQ